MNNIEIAKQFNKYIRDNNIIEQTVANATNTSQSFVSRIRTGNFKRITENVKKVCEYASIDLDSIKKESNPAENTDIMKAIDDVWDGTDKKAKALARVIRSLKGLT